MSEQFSGFTPFPVPASREGPPRILLYTHDRAGLGHLRRTLAIAWELARRRPDARMLLVTGAPQATAFAMPPNLDVVRLPWLGQQHDEQKTDDLRHVRNLLRSQVILQTTQLFDPRLVLVDFMPGGPGNELLPVLHYLHEQRPETRIVLGLRDILARPIFIRGWWGAADYYGLLQRIYHLVLVYGTEELYNAVTEYAFPPDVAERTIYTGLIRKPDPVRPAAEIRAQLGAEDRPLVVVTVGSGTDGDHIVSAYLRLLASPVAEQLGDIVSFVVTGPSVDRRRDEQLHERAAALPRVRIVTFTPDLLSYLHAADLIIAMGGFSSVYEALAYRKRLIVIPRIESSQEQVIRARQLSRMGLLRMLGPHPLEPTRFGQAIIDALAGPPPNVQLDFGGLERTGEILTSLLDDPSIDRFLPRP